MRPRQALAFAPVAGPPPVYVQEFRLWSEHVPVLRLWNGVSTQWRSDFGGRSGLDYCGVRAAPAFRRIPRADRERVFEDLVVVEQAWLARRATLQAQRDAHRTAHPHALHGGMH